MAKRLKDEDIVREVNQIEICDDDDYMSEIDDDSFSC
jgi:hypothetical protein